MKKNILLLQFCIIPLISSSQIVKPFNLKDFEGKKIVSLFKSTTELKGSYPGLSATPTNQYHTVNRYLIFQNDKNNSIIKKVVSRVNIGIENMANFEKQEFDTDRKFDRSMEATMVYGKYDKSINKPYVTVYNNQNKRIDTLSNFKDDNFYFDIAWGDDMLPFLQEDLLGIFQISLPKTGWQIGQSWNQVIQRKTGMVTKNETITNTYTVKSINNDEVILEIRGINIPEQVMYKMSHGYVGNTLKDNKIVNKNEKINYTIEQKADYEGTIKLNMKNNMVLKMAIKTNSFKRIHTKDNPTEGPESSIEVTIENTLEDLK